LDPHASYAQAIKSQFGTAKASSFNLRYASFTVQSPLKLWNKLDNKTGKFGILHVCKSDLR
jgi:hypothetical protein